MIHSKDCLLVFLILISAAFSIVPQDQCRSFSTCARCLLDPQCGWCESQANCVPGNKTGPYYGSCGEWDFYSCGTPPPPPTPTPPNPPPSGSGWTMFGGNQAHTGFQEFTVGSKKPKQEWRSRFGTGTHCSASVVVDNRIYSVFGVGSIWNWKATLEGRDAKTGDYVMKVSLGAVSTFSAAASTPDGKFLSIETIGVNEGVVMFHIDTDKKAIAWKGSGQSQWANYPYGPLIEPKSERTYFYDGQYNGLLHAYSKEGSSLFDKPLYSTSAGCDWSAPASWEGDDFIYWTTAPGAGSPGTFGAVNADGASEWTYPLNSTWDGYSTHSTPAISATGIAAVTYRPSMGQLSLAAINLKTKNSEWVVNCTHPQGFSRDVFIDYSPAIGDSVVALTCEYGVRLFDIKNGDLKGNLNCNNCYGQPLLTPDYVFVPSKAGTLMLDRKDGTSTLVSNQVGTLAFYDEMLYVTSMNDCTVTAFSFQ